MLSLTGASLTSRLLPVLLEQLGEVVDHGAVDGAADVVPALAAARDGEPFVAPRVAARERGVIHDDDARVIAGGGPAQQLAEDQRAHPAEPAHTNPVGSQRAKVAPPRLPAAERIVKQSARHAPC